MLRFLIAVLYAVLMVILSLPAHCYFAILRKKNPLASRRKAAKYVRGFFRGLLFLCGTRIHVRGEENLPSPDTPALYVSNHRSYFDIIVTQTVLNRPVGFIAKKEFRKIPFFRGYMTDIGCVYLDRKNVREGLKTMNEATQLMKGGLSMGLYPEGTRNKGEGLLPFKEGGYRIAERSSSPIVLVALTGTREIYEGNRPCHVKATDVTISFSRPFYPHQMERTERKAFYNSIPDRMAEMLKESSMNSTVSNNIKK